MSIASTPSAEVLAAYFREPVELSAIEAGHINDTYKVQAKDGLFILQRVSAIFSPRVNEDIAALTPHLKRCGLRTPELVPSRNNTLWHVASDGGVWRVLTFLKGQTYLSATGPDMVRAAGHFLARFHRSLSGVSHTFVACRLGVHDTDAHLLGLKNAIVAHPDHAAAGDVRPLAKQVFALIDCLAPMPALPQRIVHGDPKLANFLFANEREVEALVDLDTLGEMEVALELGDALRSWSNSGPGGGEGHMPKFEPSLFAASIEGYAEGAQGLLTGEEAARIADSTLRIALELAARFLRDALEERYFSWNKQRFAHAFEHHLERARSQLGFAASLQAELSWARQTVAHTLPHASVFVPAQETTGARAAPPK